MFAKLSSTISPIVSVYSTTPVFSTPQTTTVYTSSSGLGQCRTSISSLAPTRPATPPVLQSSDCLRPSLNALPGQFVQSTPAYDNSLGHQPNFSRAQQVANALPKVRLPEFWPDTAELWFATVESVLENNLVFGERERYNIVLTSLKQEQIKQIRHVIMDRDGAMPYTNLKAALIKCYEVNEVQRINTLLNDTILGDKRSSALLNEMKSLLGNCGTHSPTLETLFKKVFLDRLPSNVRLILASDYDTSIETLAAKADSIWSVGSPASLATQTVSTPSSKALEENLATQTLINNNLQLQVNKLVDELSSLMAKPPPPWNLSSKYLKIF
uniref:Uncharacterized protein LOC100176143 n=1 Tax=Phallusia mammillata TaxID=59560 RepID=A0A6F9DGF4_9ASCI|nr:uncharacterized protein LOC100176143 [Phallusia mammillata]